MQSQATSPEAYIAQLPEDRKEAILKLRATILDNLPQGFVEEMSYGNIGYVVPHSPYPKGYHCNPKLPLPYIGIASQKNYISLYHFAIYADEQLTDWFRNEYPKHSQTKLDMGKGCIRFKKTTDIPYPLIGELIAMISAEDLIAIYETHIKR